MTTLASTVANAHEAGRDLAREEANRKIVLAFFDTDDIDERLKNVADNYKQHNPLVADGKEGVRKFFTEMHKLYPTMKARVVHVAADGDLVWVHAHLTVSAQDPGSALVDIFRLENGKIVEHWDVIQPVPPTATNRNSMF